MQFGREFPRILKVIWKADPAEVIVQFSKVDVTNAYHCGTLPPFQVGYFVYVVPDDDGIIICINLVMPMGWIDSPKFFCVFL